MLRFLGLVFLAGIFLAAGMFGAWYYHDVQARKFVTAAIPAMYRNWDPEAMHRRALPAMLEEKELEGGAHQMFDFMSRALGPLQSVEPLEGSMRYGWGDEHIPRGFIGRYWARARFERDQALVSIGVVKSDGVWRITHFKVESDALTEAFRDQAKAELAKFLPGSRADEEAVAAQSHEVLRKLDEGRPGSVWDDASSILQRKGPRARFVSEFQDIFQSVGERRGRKIRGIGFLKDLPGYPPGEYAQARFEVTYARASVRETLIFHKENGQWMLAFCDFQGAGKRR
jgi:hypothetical protein